MKLKHLHFRETKCGLAVVLGSGGELAGHWRTVVRDFMFAEFGKPGIYLNS